MQYLQALENILNLVLDQVPDANFGYSIQNGAVIVGPRDTLRQTNYLHFYDIVDITQPRPDFPAPKLALDEFEGQGDDDGGFASVDDDDDGGGRNLTFQIQHTGQNSNQNLFLHETHF